MSLLNRLFPTIGDRSFAAAAARSMAAADQRAWLDRNKEVQVQRYARVKADAKPKAGESDWITAFVDGREAIRGTGRQSGFTLIELMIVVAIVALLAAIAVPAYQNYTVRAQVSEGLGVADSMRTGVAEFFQNNGAWPTDTAAAGDLGGTAGKYVGNSNVTSGTIGVNFGGNANSAIQGKWIFLVPYLSTDGSTILWACTYAPAPTNANATQPNDTAGQSAQSQDNTAQAVPPQYLPATCRANT